MGNPAPQTRTKASKPDLKPKHRHSGSVSNISIPTEDFTSPSRDNGSSTSAVSSISLKEKRLKRRTRSSLGGTEDFIKELDFLTPSPNKEKSESSTPEDLPKPSPSKSAKSQLAEPALLSGAAEALAPVPEASVPEPVDVDVAVENLPIEEGKAPGAENGHASKVNGAAPGAEALLVSSVEKSVQPGGACELAEGTNGAEPGKPATFGRCAKEPHQVVKAVENNGTALKSGHLLVMDRGIPLAGTFNDESSQSEPMDVLPETEVPDLNSEMRSAPESPVPDTAGGSTSEETIEHKGLTKSYTGEVQPASVGSPTIANSQVAPGKEELSKAEQRVKKRQEEEKVSVQRRIEELERIAGGRPVHFRSQSLSLPRPFDISHARHHEAEGSKSFKMPLYRAPLDGISVSEVDGSEFVETSQGVAHGQAAPDSEMTTLMQGTLPAEPASQSGVHENGPTPQDIEPQTEEKAEDQAMTLVSGKRSDMADPDPDDGPVLLEALKTENVAPGNMVNDMHLEKGLPAEGPAIASKGSEGLPASKMDSVEEPQVLVQSNTQAAAIDQELIGKGKEDFNPGSVSKTEGGLESGLGEEYVIVSAVPEETVTTKELPSEATESKQACEDSMSETAEDRVLAETPAEGRLLEATALNSGMVPGPPLSTVHSAPGVATSLLEAPRKASLPEVPKKSKFPEAASVEAPRAERSLSQDDETSVLLTKQPAVDPLFIDSQQDRLWEMHSQELALREGESSGQEVRESSAQDDDPSQYANGTPTYVEAAASSSVQNGNTQSEKSGKIDRPRTPLRSLLAEEEAAEKDPGPESGPRSTTPQNQIVSPRGNLFKRIVSGGKNSPTKQTTPSKFSPKNQATAKPFLSSCICCSPVK